MRSVHVSHLTDSYYEPLRDAEPQKPGGWKNRLGADYKLNAGPKITIFLCALKASVNQSSAHAERAAAARRFPLWRIFGFSIRHILTTWRAGQSIDGFEP